MSWFKTWETESFRLVAEWPEESGVQVNIILLDGFLEETSLATLEECISEVLRGEYTNPVSG
jgi:hypothetical protein